MPLLLAASIFSFTGCNANNQRADLSKYQYINDSRVNAPKYRYNKDTYKFANNHQHIKSSNSYDIASSTYTPKGSIGRMQMDCNGNVGVTVVPIAGNMGIDSEGNLRLSFY